MQSDAQSAEAGARVDAGVQAGLGAAPPCPRLQHAHAMLRYMRTLACRLLDVEALLLWEQETVLAGGVAGPAAGSSAEDASTVEDVIYSRRVCHKSVQTNPTERNRFCDVIEAQKLVQVYERCYQMMLEEMRRACAACGGSAGCGEGGGGGASGGGGGGTSVGVGGGGAAAGEVNPRRPLRQRRAGGWRRLLRGVFTRNPHVPTAAAAAAPAAPAANVGPPPAPTPAKERCDTRH